MFGPVVVAVPVVVGPVVVETVPVVVVGPVVPVVVVVVGPVVPVVVVVVGPPVPDRSVTLRWSNPTGRICPRVDNATHEATKKLWLLTLGDDGDYRADNPWRVIDLEDLTERSQARELWEELRRLEPDRRSPAQESVLAFLDRLLVAPAGS